MQVETLHRLIFAIPLVLTTSIVPCQAQVEQIPALTLPHTVMDFEAIPPDPRTSRSSPALTSRASWSTSA